MANTLLRGATIGIRGTLIVGLAVWLDPAELGVFGLIGATIALAIQIYGHDFYVYTVRQLSVAELGDVRYRLRDQFLLFGAIYTVGTVALAALLPLFGLDPALALLTAAIAVFQHVSVELYRVLLRLERTVSASLCFFVRDAAWVPACPLVWWLRGGFGLSDILLLWLAGSIAATGYAAWSVLRATPAAPPRPIDRAWLARGIRTGLRMLPGTLSLRGLFTVDRMIMALVVPPEALGAYVFFASLCTAATGLFESGIMPYFWPRLLEAARTGGTSERVAAERALVRACVIGAPALAVAAVAAGVVLAKLMPHEAYGEHLGFVAWIAAAYFFVTVSNIPHYRLYAANRDLAIVASNGAAFAVFLALAGLLVLAGWVLAVPVALVSASVLLLVFKWAAARHYGA